MTIVYRRSGTQLLARGRPPRTPGPGVAQRLRLHEASARFVEAVDNFVIGTTMPTAANTGPRIPIGSAQTVNGTGGKITYSTAGEVVSGKVFNCQVVVNAANVTFRDCWFYGSTTLKYIGAALLEFNASGGTVEFSELTAYSGGVDRTRYWLNGVKTADGTTIRRVNIHDVCDGISLQGNGVRITAPYIHDLAFRSDDGDHKSDSKLPWWTHNDCIQFAYADDCIIEGPNLQANYSTVSGMIGDPSAPGITSAGVVDPAMNHGAPATGEWPNAHGMLIGPRSGNITNLQVNRAWIGAGNYGIQITTQGRGFDTGNSGSFFGNRIYANQTGAAAVTPAQFVVANSIGTFTGVDTTIYALDDLSVPLSWRGKPIQSPTSTGGGTYRFNSSLTPPA